MLWILIFRVALFVNTSQQEGPENGLSFQEAGSSASGVRSIRGWLTPKTRHPTQAFVIVLHGLRIAFRNAAEARQFFRDMGDQFSGGIADIGTVVGQMVNIFDPTTSSARERGDVPIGDRMANASREWGQSKWLLLSPEMLHDQNDPDWLSLGNVVATMGRSAPSLIPTLVGGGSVWWINHCPGHYRRHDGWRFCGRHHR